MEELIIDKIKKLLALAGNNPSESEAQSAIAKAQELMIKHNIEESKLGRATKQEAIWAKVGNHTRKPNHHEIYIMSAVAKHFKCFSTLKGRDNDRRLWILGMKSDTEIMLSTYNFAVSIFEARFDSYLKNLKNTREYTNPSFGQTMAYKNAFMLGYCKGLTDALTENERRFALVVQLPEEVNDILKTLHIKSANAVMRVDKSGRAEASGFKAGQEFNKDKKGLN